MKRSKMILLTALASLVLLPGCGGRSSDDAFVTSRSAASLDPDATRLAAREVGGYTVPLDIARSFDTSLRTARRAFPELESIHAASSYNPYTINFALRNDAPWLSQWKAGTLTTGVQEIDDQFHEFQAKKVAFVREDGDQSWFAVSFETYLRAHRAAGFFIDKSPSIRIVSAASIPNVETDIQYQFDAPSTTRLTFITGTTTTVLEKIGEGSWVKNPVHTGSL